MTFAELIAESSLEIFPDKLAENWQLPVKAYFKEALCDLQRMVKCLKDSHADVYPASATYFRCGTSVICAPKGQIRRIYTMPTGDWCQPIQYTRVSFEDISCWSRRFARIAGSPVNTGLPSLQQGFKFPETVTDGIFGRAQQGLWAYDEGNKNIIIAPWLQSTESVVIEWSGLKLSWTDADLVSAGQMSEDEWKRAIKAWVLSKYNKFALGDRAASQDCDAEYLDAKAMLVYDCRRITTNLDPAYACAADAPESRRAELLALQNPVVVPEVADVMAFFGDYGEAGPDELAVATLVKGWGPSAVVAGGDCNYPSGQQATIDANNGQYFRTFIKDYQGAFPLGPGETDAVSNMFWPVLGNHDVTGLPFPPTPFTDYFPSLPGNKRCYSFVQGLVEWFCIHSGLDDAGVLVEPLGNTPISVQGSWLQAKLAASVAKYKFVAWHAGGYLSDISYYPGIAALRPLTDVIKSWGADALFNSHGHQMEHLVINGLNIFVNGAGGAPLRAVHNPPVTGSDFTYTAMHGAIRISVVNAAATVEFRNVDDVVLKSVQITNSTPPYTLPP